MKAILIPILLSALTACSVNGLPSSCDSKEVLNILDDILTKQDSNYMNGQGCLYKNPRDFYSSNWLFIHTNEQEPLCNANDVYVTDVVSKISNYFIRSQDKSKDGLSLNCSFKLETNVSSKNAKLEYIYTYDNVNITIFTKDKNGNRPYEHDDVRRYDSAQVVKDNSKVKMDAQPEAAQENEVSKSIQPTQEHNEGITWDTSDDMIRRAGTGTFTEQEKYNWKHRNDTPEQKQAELDKQHELEANKAISLEEERKYAERQLKDAEIAKKYEQDSYEAATKQAEVDRLKMVKELEANKEMSNENN